MIVRAGKAIEAWENEGGAAPAPFGDWAVRLQGTASQVEWAERIRMQVSAEFDRVASSFRAVAKNQSGGKRADIADLIALLEEKRAEVMKREQAGYFIQTWQEINDQVRQMIFHDTRYPAIRARLEARRKQRGSA